MNASQRLAIIDLGTNTFHLLIIESTDVQWRVLYRNRVFVNLAEVGITRIGEKAMKRGLETMHAFSETIRGMDVQNVQAVGTAALRTANNAEDLVNRISRETGITPRIISGDEEAGLITRGVRCALPAPNTPWLIMDIGGGSVEFILVAGGKSEFTSSYPIGVAVLYEKFHDTEPIRQSALLDLDAYLDEMLNDLFEAVVKYKDCTLVGASGTFEVVDSIVGGSLGLASHSEFRVDEFEPIYNRIISMGLKQRYADPDIPETRARYLVVAMHLIKFVLARLKTQQAYISAFAMKEGIAHDWKINLD